MPVQMEMEDVEQQESSEASVAKLIAFFETATQEQRPQPRITRNGPRRAQDDLSEALAQKNQVPERETLEEASKDHKGRAEESIKDGNVTLWKVNEQELSRERTTERSEQLHVETAASRRPQCVNQTLTKPSAGLETEGVCVSEQRDTFMRLCGDKRSRELGAKPKKRLQNVMKSELPKDHLWKERCAGLEVEKRRLLEENRAMDEEHLKLCKREKQEKYCVALEWEIAELKSRKSVMQGEIDHKKGTQGRQEASKDPCFDLEDEKSQLLVEIKSLNEESAKLCQREERGPSEQQCAELEKEVEALKSQRGALQSEIEHGKSRPESQEDFRERLAQFEAEKRDICSKMKALQDQLEEINMKTEPQWSIELSSELQIEMAGLKRETGVLQKQIKQAICKLEQQDAIKQRCLEFEGVINGIREERDAFQDKLTQLSDKLEPDICAELCLERAKDMEKQIVALRSHTGVLKGELERANAKLQQQTSEKECCLELEAETRRVQDKNESIWREISQTLREFAEEKSWKHKLEATLVMKHTMESENEQLLKHKEKLDKDLDVLKTAFLEYKLQLQEMSKMWRDNLNLQQDVDKLVTDIRNHKSEMENYKDMLKTDPQVKAKNKKLRKNVKRLQEELEKLGPVEVELQNFVHGMDEVRKENHALYDKIRALNEEMTSKKMLQVRLKSLKAEREWMLQRGSGMRLEISWLRGVRLEQLPLHEEKAKWDERNERLQLQNRQLRRNLKELFVEALSAKVHQVLTSVAKTQSEEMDLLNQELTEEIQEFETSTE